MATPPAPPVGPGRRERPLQPLPVGAFIVGSAGPHMLAEAEALRDAEVRAVAGAFADGAMSGAKPASARELPAAFEEKLVGIVSHDMRDLLQSISLSTAALLLGPELEPRVRHKLQRIGRTVDRASRLIRDLLDFAQTRLAGDLVVCLAPVELPRVVEDALDELAPRFPERWIERVHHGDARGLWDADRLVQVVLNLLTNACKYSPEGTPILVRTGGDDTWATLEVQNAGEPIPPEQIDRLFAPFERAGKPPGHTYGGLGLGLFIVDQLVRSHDGTVEVVSSREDGTRFTVRLPRRGPPRADAAPDACGAR